MAMMGGLGSIMDFVQRYRDYEAQRNTTHEFIKDLMIHAEHVESTLRNENDLLRKNLRDLQLDLDDASKSRRELQQRLRDVEGKMGYGSHGSDQLKNRNAYILVLIDGDGLLFKEEFIRQGVEGGRKAANRLRQAIAEHCYQMNDTEIVTKVFANLSGLNKAMKRDGAVDGEVDLRDFMLGFNQAAASFDFIDIGYGKELADFKIKETTRFHLRNYNCKQILLGISHDAGYAPFLHEMIRDNGIRERITILEGFPTVREIVATGVHIISFHDVFRSERLVAKSPPSIHSSISSSSPAPGASSWASVTQRASPPPQITLPLAPKSTPPVRTSKPQPIVWNPGPRGLDPPISLNQTALEGIKKRKDSSKLCNNHYLRGPCAKGDECCFEHDYSPSKDEKHAIAFLARLNPCTNGQDCEVENCIYGHHCPSVVNGICTHPFCKFRAEEHPPGTKFKNPKV
ncbi:hypothetical protein F5Y15DRAFT_175650 [Xylariaceae sp. FL0016]|nr:hypothetical protein F5Y15DRAFT_175650 [Xylariaceae sp. FL0016]